MFRIEKRCRDLTYEIDTLKVQLEEAESKHRTICSDIAGAFTEETLIRQRLFKLLWCHGAEILSGESFEIIACSSKSAMLQFLRVKGFIGLMDTRYEQNEFDPTDITTYWLLKATPLFIKELTELMTIHDIKE